MSEIEASLPMNDKLNVILLLFKTCGWNKRIKAINDQQFYDELVTKQFITTIEYCL
jgi:hypothetical protein